METQERISRYSFDETVEKLMAGIEISGLKVVARIDARENLKKIGIEIGGNTIFEVFHPGIAREVFQKDIRAGIVPPIRIYVYEAGGMTHVAAQNAAALFSGYNGLEEIGKKVDGMIERALSAIN